MRIYLHEIKENETELDFTQDDAWVRDVVARADETPDADESAIAAELRPARVNAPPKPTAERPIALHVSLRKVDDVVVMNGDLQTEIQLVCSRCAIPFAHVLQPRFSALFCKDPVMAGVGYLGQGKDQKPEGQIHGMAKHHRDGTGRLSEDADGSSVSAQDADLDITYLAHDYLELSDALSEQIHLQIPFQPLCKPDCQGVCATCGTDLNQGRCACSRIRKDNPFSILKDLKLS